MSNVTTKILRGRKAVFDLEAEYVELYESLPCPNVYNSPEWVYSWLITLGRNYEVCFITSWENGILSGVWPFFETKFPILGKGLMPTCVHSADCFDPIATHEALNALAEAAIDLADKYSFIWVPLLTRDFAHGTLQTAFSKKRSKHLLRQRTRRFLVELEKFKDFDTYANMVFGPKTRQNLRRKARRLGEEGEVQYHSLEKPEEIIPWIPKTMKLEQAGWKGEQGVGVFKRGDQRAFYHLVMENLAAKGRLRLSLLTIEDHLLSYEIGLLGRDYYCMHSMSYDPTFAANSPGRILMLLTIETCFKEKRRIYDFMQNDQEFKRQMSTHESSFWDCIFLPQSFRGLLLVAIFKLIHFWTQWKNRKVNKEGALERDQHPAAGGSQVPPEEEPS